MTKLVAEYPNKCYADFSVADRKAMRRYEQGKIHAKQGRTDLYGICEHYDAGFEKMQGR